jgi:hypothetical protein
MSDGLRQRIDAALSASIDSCARCKVCDIQVDAVMGVMAAEREEAASAAPLPISNGAQTMDWRLAG